MIAVERTGAGRITNRRNTDGGLDSRRDQPAATAAGWMF